MSKLFKPMLASSEVVLPHEVVYPCMASPKLDGIRSVIIEARPMSRTMKPIPNHHVQTVLSQPFFEGFDGELIVGDPTAENCFNVTTSGVMKVSGTPDFKFYVFDLVTNGTSDERYAEFLKRYEQIDPAWKKFIEVVPQHTVHDAEIMTMTEEVFHGQGYEGVIARRIDAEYKNGRSTKKEGIALKLKRFEDSEAEILGWYQGTTNTNTLTRNALGHAERSTAKAGKVLVDRIGGFDCRDIKTGVEFKLGCGGTQEELDALWEIRDTLVGRFAKYRFQPVGVKHKPRFPIFLGLRHEDDMS